MPLSTQRLFQSLFITLSIVGTVADRSRAEELVSWFGMEEGQTQTVPLADESAEAIEERLRWWREARFGMFIHWGPVSLKGTEIGWSRAAQVPAAEYDELYKKFNPVKFDADQWARIAKAAGMKYLVITTKHHDGFCLFESEHLDYNIMNTPFQRDVCAELAEACKKHGIKFCTYYSVTDWWHPLHPLGSPGGSVKKPNPDINKYEALVNAQVRELVTKYGPLGIMWYDYPQGYSREQGKRLYEFTRSLQPDIIVNDRTGAGGDYYTPEQRAGKFNNQQPWESCMTIGHQWAWRPNEQIKSLEQCLQALITCAAGDGNLLFNVGPSALGEIEPDQVKRLEEMGQWLEKYGASVYGTRGGPFKPADGVASTYKDKSIFVHIMKWNGDAIRLPAINAKIVAHECLTGGQATVLQDDSSITLSVPAEQRQAVDTIIKLDLDRAAGEIAAVSIQ